MLLPKAWQDAILSYFIISPLLVCLGATGSVAAQANKDLDWVPFDQEQFSGNVSLDEKGDVHLFWKTGDEYSTYGVASKSSGYLALGFSETGAMTGADMAVGYTDDSGEFQLENYHAAGFVFPEPSEDQENNIRLKEGSQKDGVTSFVFEKKNKVDCVVDQTNVATEAWQWFIYAFSDENSFAQHEDGNMGKKYVKLGTGKTVSVNEIRQMDKAKNFTVVQPEVTIPTDETTYCYSLHKVPAGRKNYMIGEKPEEASDMLHHLVLYACYGLPEEYEDMVGKKPDCNWQEFSNPCNGFVTEWAPGMSGRTFEPGYGKLLGGDQYEYVMLETHYNNPGGVEGSKDKAKYTILYNDEPVDTEIGTLTLGNVQVNGWTLEPGKELVSRSTVCTPECTKKWPKEGITAFSVFHHMHYRGRHSRVQIIRDGKEIEPLSSLRDFVYDFQFSKNLDQVKLLPGDKLITTCEFDTSNDTKPVRGGQPSKDEMCFAWVDYYPANSILACSQYDLGDEDLDGLNGTVALCQDSSQEDPELYDSTFLTSSFQNRTSSGDSCDASTEEPSENDDADGSGGSDASNDTDDDDSASLFVPSLGLTVSISALSLGLIYATGF